GDYLTRLCSQQAFITHHSPGYGCGSPGGARIPKNAELCWPDVLNSTHGPASSFLQLGRKPVNMPPTKGAGVPPSCVNAKADLQQMLYSPIPLVTRSGRSAMMTVFETPGGVKLKVRTPLGSAGPASPHPSAGSNVPKLAVNIPESA